MILCLNEWQLNTSSSGQEKLFLATFCRIKNDSLVTKISGYMGFFRGTYISTRYPGIR